MRRIMGLMMFVIVLAGSVSAATYTIDKAHTNVSFKIRHMMVSKVQGSFDDFEGTVEFQEGEPATWSTDVVIQANSIDTNNKKRDIHLRSKDFFDAKQFPTLTFSASGARQEGDEFLVDGELTMHGVTRTVTLKVDYNGMIRDSQGNERIGFSAATKIDRSDFGMTFNRALETGGVVVGDEVSILLEVEAVRQ